VDTYDVQRGVRTAIEVAGTSLGAVRIDSGDLPALAVAVRGLLDSLGAPDTRIILTGDLDEYSIAGLAVAPVNGYGVGTSLVTGSGAPTAALVYKLVARSDGDISGAGAAAAAEADGAVAAVGADGAVAAAGGGELRPVAKRSVGKPGRGGRKWAMRHRTDTGEALTERISLVPPDPGPADRVLLHELVREGKIVGREPLSAARERHQAALAELPAYALQLSRGYPAIPTVFDPNGDDN